MKKLKVTKLPKFPEQYPHNLDSPTESIDVTETIRKKTEK